MNNWIWLKLFFGTSEYIKDGAAPYQKWLGKKSMADRMLEMLYD